jgi:hypothetical protein
MALACVSKTVLHRDMLTPVSAWATWLLRHVIPAVIVTGGPPLPIRNSDLVFFNAPAKLIRPGNIRALASGERVSTIGM